MAAAGGPDLCGRGVCDHAARPANGPDPRRADSLGWLAGHHRGGVQLHERHRPPLLHGGARAGHRRGDRDRGNAVVAAPLRHPGRDGAGRHRRGQRHPRGRVVGAKRRVAAVVAGGGRRRGSRGGSTAAGGRPVDDGGQPVRWPRWPSRRAWPRPARIPLRRRRLRTAGRYRRQGRRGTADPVSASAGRADCSVPRIPGRRCPRHWPPARTTSPGPRRSSAPTMRPVTNWPAAQR